MKTLRMLGLYVSSFVLICTLAVLAWWGLFTEHFTLTVSKYQYEYEQVNIYTGRRRIVYYFSIIPYKTSEEQITPLSRTVSCEAITFVPDREPWQYTGSVRSRYADAVVRYGKDLALNDYLFSELIDQTDESTEVWTYPPILNNELYFFNEQFSQKFPVDGKLIENFNRIGPWLGDTNLEDYYVRDYSIAVIRDLQETADLSGEIKTEYSQFVIDRIKQAQHEDYMKRGIDILLSLWTF